MGEDPNRLRDHDRVDDGLRAAFGAPSDSVLDAIERLSGTRSRILLRDGPEDASPVLRIAPADEEIALADDSRYQVLGEIGRGGMGTVYKGRDKDLGRDVALKVLRADAAEEPDVLQRFVEEAQVGGQLQHPGIVPIYGLGLQKGGRPYFAMKLVKGETLASLLEGGGKGSDLIRVFERVAQTVAYAHSRGVIHRDLKPSNVMVGAFGEVHVVDWGFAKVLGREETHARPGMTMVATVRSAAEGSQSVAGSIMGTPAYMPPEQAMGQVEELTERADVFSLGAILCELLTRQPPYTGTVQDQIIAAMRARLEEAHARLAAASAPEALKQLALDCLQPLPKDRPKDAGVVAQRVAHHLASVEERARQAEIDAVHAAAEARRVRRGRRTAVALSAVALVAIVGGGGGLYAWTAAEHGRAASAAAKVAPLLRDATRREGERDWAGARAAAGTALALAETEGADGETLATVRAVHARIGATAEADRAREERLAREARLLADLDELAMQTMDLSPKEQEDGYRDAFAAFGVDPDGEGAAGMLVGFGRSSDLAVHLDGWVRLRREGHDERARSLDRLVRALDDDPWRTRLRDASEANDLEALRALAAEADPAGQRTTTLASLAESLLKAGEPRVAADLLRRSVAHHPGDFWIHHGLAKALWWGLRSASDAMTHAEAALALRPQSGGAWHVVGAIRSDGFRDPDGALRALRKAVELSPANVVFRSNLSKVLRQKGDLDGALDAAREAIRIDPRRAVGHSQLAYTLRQRGDVEGALAAVREGIRVDPKSSASFTALAAVLQGKGDIDGALDAIREAVRLDPGSALCRGLLSTALHLKGDRDGALAAIREAVRIAPSSAQHRIQLGAILSERGDAEGSVAELTEAVRLDPTNADAYSRLGSVLCDGLGRYDSALRCFREAMGLDPNFLAPRVNVGIALFKRGDFAAADEAFREAAAMDPIVSQRMGGMMADAKTFAAARARVPAVLKGDDRPRGAAEWLLLAEVCFRTADYPSSARFHKEAFAADRRAAANPRAGHRYNAARAAALAGPRWHPQAIVWLREDLDAWDAAPATAAKEVARALRRWRADPSLAVLRTGADLPAEWRALWARVDAVLARAEGATK